MGARVIHKNAFRYETRNIDDGTGRMIPRVHMIADCRKCGNESALALDAHNTQYDIGLASKKFIAIGWKMGGTRRKDVCPVCVARGKVLSAPEDERKDVSSQENLHLIRVAIREPEMAEGLLIAGEPIVSEDARAQAEMLVDIEALSAPVSVIHVPDPGAPPPGQIDLRARRAPKDGVVRVFKPEPVQKPTLLGEKILAAAAEIKQTSLNDFKAKVAELSPAEKAKRRAAVDAAKKPVSRDQELMDLVDQQARDDARVRRVGKTAPMPLPKSFTPGTPVPPKSPPPAKPLAKIIDLDDGFPKVAPILPPKASVPAVILITPVPVEEAPVPVKAKKPSKVALTDAEKLAKKDAYWASERGLNQLAAQKAGRARRRAADQGITVERLLANEAAAAALAETRAAERERKRQAKEALLAERARTDPMFPPVQVELDLTPEALPQPEVLPTPIEPEVAQTAPAPEAIKEPAMTTAEPPRTPTDADRRQIYLAFIDVYYDDGRGMYRGDWSDRKLGEKLSMPWAWVRDFRLTTGMGPDVNEADDKIGREITILQKKLITDRQGLENALSKAADNLAAAKAAADKSIDEAAQMVERAKAVYQRAARAGEDELQRIAEEGEAARVASEARIAELVKGR